MSKFPIKKIFEKDFINKKGKILFTLKYNQATIYEYYEFLNKNNEDQLRELLEIIQKSLKFNLYVRFRKLLNPFFKTRWEKSLNLLEITSEIVKNRYRVPKSIFEGLRSEKNGKGAIESVGLSNICQKYNISPTDLLHNYTLEQYFWFLDGLEWIGNSMTKEGEFINQKALIDKEAVKKRASETREKFLQFKK